MPYDAIPDRFPNLQGHGLVLREMAEEDLPAWYARLSDAEAATLAGDTWAGSMDDVVAALQHHHEAFRSKEALRWAIVPDSLGVHVGSIGLGDFDGDARSAGVGAAIGRAHWDQGLATQASRLVLDYAFRVLDLASVDAVVLARNARVIRVLEKLAFERQPGIPVGRGIGGADSESILYVLRRSSSVI